MRGAMRRWLRQHLRSRQVSRVVYGAIIGLALVVLLDAHPPTAGEAVAALLATAVAVGLAELYADLLGGEVRTGRRIDRAAVVASLDDVIAVTFGVAFPAVFYVLAALDVMEVDTATSWSIWTGLGLIAFYGFVGARVSGRGVVRSLVEAAAVGLVGGLLVVVKALVH